MCQVNERLSTLSPGAAGEQTFDAFDVGGDTNSHSHYARALCRCLARANALNYFIADDTYILPWRPSHL